MVRAIQAIPAEQTQAAPGLALAPERYGLPADRADQIRSVVVPFAASRALLLTVTIIGVVIRGLPPLTLWNQWDALWYTGIAGSGYHFSLHGKPALAFFPLFPMLLHPFSAA